MIKVITIPDWTDFEDVVRQETKLQLLVARNFMKTTFEDLMGSCKEINSLQITIQKGTDRTSTSEFWNADNFDHDHENNPMGKSPEDIIYGSLIDMTFNPYHASVPDGNGGHSLSEIDITTGLTDQDAITIYDFTKLKRVSPNEYWFQKDALEAALFIITIT